MVGEIALETTRVIPVAERAKPAERWTVATPIDYLDGYTTTASLLWTGGTVLPLAAWEKYSLRRGSDGALLIELKERTLVDLFYFFPVRLTDQTWLRYPLLPSVEANAEKIASSRVSP